MRSNPLTVAAAWLFACACSALAQAQTADPRLKEVWYDAQAVITVPVKRGVVTHVVLDRGEAITDVGSGLGADCSKPDASWCIAAQAGGRHIFVKPKSSASAANNLAVVTDKRTHAFRFVVLADGDARLPVYRLSVRVPSVRPAEGVAALPAGLGGTVDPDTSSAAVPIEVEPPSPAAVVAERLAAAPELVNSNYSIAEGAGFARHPADAGLRRWSLHLLPVSEQPGSAGRVQRAGRRLGERRQRPHGRRSAGGRSGQPAPDAARRLGRRRRVERGLRCRWPAADRRHHRGGRAPRAEARAAAPGLCTPAGSRP